MAETCPYVEKCGGCHVGTHNYLDELDDKKAFVKKHIGKYCKVRDVAGMFYPYHYPAKVHAVFGKRK